MDVQAEFDALVEGGHWLARAVDVYVLLRLHIARLVVNRRLDHAVSDRLQTSSCIFLIQPEKSSQIMKFSPYQITSFDCLH